MSKISVSLRSPEIWKEDRAIEICLYDYDVIDKIVEVFKSEAYDSIAEEKTVIAEDYLHAVNEILKFKDAIVEYDWKDVKEDEG